ncbi:hypothetical protein CAFE_17710 [Caprobacter fermentans]|uniref:Uncharacterized protein n=1 Tax=Caproicibacter fermentans TaxID=2576756 RepID=A0A6N8HZD6_9FIRM|nr:peptidylprolyl isomerase [Caproicibacter fermentans]MVB11069.1 hypothetical protein [Caproicibacter fermentans]
MTIAELETRRDGILQAIKKIENGAQEYRIGTRTVQRADLATLYAEYRMVSKEIDLIARPGTTVAFLRRRR